MLISAALVCHSLGLSNGSIIYTPESGPPYNFHTVALHMCDDGFSLSGSVMRVCEEEGTNLLGVWSGEPAFCDRKSCPSSHIVYICYCVSFSHAAIVCEALILHNGLVSYSSNNTVPPFFFGTVATFECVSGHSLSGNGERTCFGDGLDTVGEWSGENVSCQCK